MEACLILDMCTLPPPQVLSVQMCDVVNEIELERERCENSTFGNVTSGNYQTHFPLSVWGVQEAI